uniref:Uncharacterized protein n=1 Tax=Lepeophtheirus salmonis TaxID=72036 RepID=A0A0K2VJ94_LEPSM
MVLPDLKIHQGGI